MRKAVKRNGRLLCKSVIDLYGNNIILKHYKYTEKSAVVPKTATVHRFSKKKVNYSSALPNKTEPRVNGESKELKGFSFEQSVNNREAQLQRCRAF